jgi:uncharacterized membrane protein
MAMEGRRMDTEPEGERGTVMPVGTIEDRRHAPPWTWVLVGILCIQFLLMTVAVAVGAIITHDISQATTKATLAAENANRATTRLDGAVVGSCQRLQAERERSNVEEATIFLVLGAASRASSNLRARKVYAEQAAATAWSPPANCDRAVNDPRHYRPPPPIPFVKLPAGYAARIVRAAKDGKPQPLP